MFTGIIEEIGTIKSLAKGPKSAKIEVACSHCQKDLSIGESIAVNGACLTVTRFDQKSFTADIMAETLDRTTLGELKAGDSVNLERALPATGRFNGHMVQGHIDAHRHNKKNRKTGAKTAFIISKPQPPSCPISWKKARWALNGISLTVAAVMSNRFSVALIPHTLKITTFGKLNTGDRINLETDIIGKYIVKLMGKSPWQRQTTAGNPKILRFYLAS